MKKMFTLLMLCSILGHIHSQITENFWIPYGPKALCNYTKISGRYHQEIFRCHLLESDGQTIVTIVYDLKNGELKVKKCITWHHCMPSKFVYFRPWDYPPEKENFKVVRPSRQDKKNFPKVAESVRNRAPSKITKI